MNKQITAIFYTSNKEDEVFENKIKDKLLAVCGDIPIVSISQKPIELGKNICVGDVGASDHNLFRQILMGCREAQTPYIISCEADCLYPPEYFQFIPDGIWGNYRFNNLYILNEWGKGEWGGFWPKTTAPFAQITNREWYIKEIEKALEGKPEWTEDQYRVPIFMDGSLGWNECSMPNPIISLKTGRGMRKHTKATGEPVAELPHWGKATDLRRSLWG